MNSNNNRLLRYFSGNYSQVDYTFVRTLFLLKKHRFKLKKLLLQHWDNFEESNTQDVNLDHVLNNLHDRMYIDSSANLRSRFFIVFQRIACVLFLPLLFALGIIMSLQINTNQLEASAIIECPLGVRTSFTLPDGTKGYLNSGSTLSYPIVFSKNRTVKLKGEAFFDVIKDAAHPFRVETKHLCTKVLGTEFDVIAYPDEVYEEIILREGKVEVYSANNKKLDFLTPNQNIIYDTTTKNYKKGITEAEQYISWTEGKLVFRNETMVQVAKRLSRWYGVKIEIKTHKVMDYRFRATFINESLDEVLHLLSLTAPIRFEEKDRIVGNDNTYGVRKINIYIDNSRVEKFE